MRTVGCEEVRPLLSMARDGEASPEVEAELARHLARCGACARYNEELVALDALCRSAHREPELAFGPIRRFIAPKRRETQEGVAALARARARRAAQSGARRSSSRMRAYGSALGHPIARLAAMVLVVAGAFVALRTFRPDIDPLRLLDPETAVRPVEGPIVPVDAAPSEAPASSPTSTESALPE